VVGSKLQLHINLWYFSGSLEQRGMELPMPNTGTLLLLGTAPPKNYRRRVTKALLQYRDSFIKWPDFSERKQISKEIHQQYDFPHCVGIADATLFPLAFQPQTVDAPCYSGRKYGFSLSTMIICDHNRKIR
jgi:hypothetical protein